MSKPRCAARSALVIAALMAGVAPAATAAPKAERACFLSKDWEGWSAPGDGDALYLRVGVRDIYRVGLAPGSHVRKRGDEFLINRVRGSSWICSPLDLDLDIADHLGIREPLFVRSLRKLTPEEVAAIPRKDLP